MAVLALTIVTASSAQSEAPFFQPASAEQWPDDLPPLARAVVVVGAIYETSPRRQAGNGVIVAGDVDGKAWVLTCAHIVERADARATTVRVGVLRHSRVSTSPDEPEYEESIARIVSSSSTHDVALLEVEAGGALHEAMVSRHRIGRVATSLVSLVPYQFPVVERAVHHVYRPGQSGSPLFFGGRVVGLAQNTLGGRLGVEVVADDLVDFVSRLPQARSLLDAWAKADAGSLHGR